MCGKVLVRNSPREAVRIKSNMLDIFCLHEANSSMCAAIVRILLSLINQPSNKSPLHSHVTSKLQFKMASGSLLSKVMLEEKLVELWPEYSCLYDVSSSEFKNRDRREVAMTEIAEKLEPNGG